MASAMKRSGEMWVREEDTFMPRHFDVSGDRFEIEHLDAALAFCPGRKLAVDVGAHYGSWSRHLARQFEEVLAFEPVQTTFDCLVRNTKPFSNIRVFRQAVGNTQGRVSVGVGKMYQHPGMETVIGYDGDIDLVRIDDLELSALDFIKIDVEGFELQVLQGAERTLQCFRPIVLFEENIRGPLEHNVENGSCQRFLENLDAKLLTVQNKDFIFGW
ncbi:MAG: hypothetical protein QOF19_866 [Alphaproteobacteria bacterium]|jgi:FkbM family methyltransferase|nr:hypothetical protein [Alphaproteobacteria bacterium]